MVTSNCKNKGPTCKVHLYFFIELIPAFPHSGSSSAGIRVISAFDIGQATNTGEIPLLFWWCFEFRGSRIRLVQVGRLGQ